ncbi:hypothetical protein WJX82_006750 [Trebouxia sp. C0006]
MNGLVTAFLGSGLPIYRQAVLHGVPFIYILKWMHTLSFITDPKWHVLYVWLFIAPFVILSCQTVYLPGTVHWENVSIPLCLLDCRSVFSKHYLDWADEADLVDEQTSEEDDWSDEDVLAYGTTRLAPGVVPSLLRGFWPLSSHGQGPKGAGVSPAVSSPCPRRSSGLAYLYEQAYARGVLNQKIGHPQDSASGRGPAAAVTPLRSAPEGAGGDASANSTASARSVGGGVRPPRPTEFTSHPKLRPGSSGPGAAKTSGRPTTKANPEMDIGLSDPSEGLISARRAPSSYPLGKAPGVLSQEPDVSTAGESQETAPQPQPKLEKQGSGLKKGLKKVKNGVKTVTDKVKDRTSRRIKTTPGPISTPAAPPAQGSTTSGSELQRGGSLKDKLKKKFSRRTRGQKLFV